MAFAVVVTFQVNPDQMAAFVPLMLANATTSRTMEPGCQQFDVATDPARPGEVFLYERYNDRAAFDVHLATAHFAEFDTATASMITSKDVRTYGEVQP